MAKRSPYLVRWPTNEINDEHLVRDVLETMWRSVDIYKGYDELQAGLGVATPGQVAVFAVCRCDSEVCNGGFHQLLYNSTGILFQDAVQGFRRIGAIDHARCFSEVASLMPLGEAPRDRAKRIKLLEQVPDEEWISAFEPIEKAYYALEDTEKSIEHYARQYIMANPEEFFTEVLYA